MDTKNILTMSEPEKLFSKKGIRKEYWALAKKFHPDNYVFGSSEVFAKISELYKIGLKKIDDNIWDNSELILYDKILKKDFKFTYTEKEVTEYGNRFISKQHIVLTTKLDNFANIFRFNANLCQTYLSKSTKMHDNFTNLIPVIGESRLISNIYGDVLLLERPTPEFQKVQSILDKYSVINHKHATWIISRLMNLVVLLNKSGMVHNGISSNSVFINGPEHMVALLDGWWYSTRRGTRVKSIKTKDIILLSKKERENKITTSKFDIECVKQLGRNFETEETPKQIKHWLKIPASVDALAELEHWQNKIIISAYGERKFTPWEL